MRRKIKMSKLTEYFLKTDFVNERLSEEQKHALDHFDKMYCYYEEVVEDSGNPSLEYKVFVDLVYKHRDDVSVMTPQEMDMVGSLLGYNMITVQKIIDILFMFDVFEANPNSAIYKKKLEDE
jgi:hypothetical protein